MCSILVCCLFVYLLWVMFEWRSASLRFVNKLKQLSSLIEKPDLSKTPTDLAYQLHQHAGPRSFSRHIEHVLTALGCGCLTKLVLWRHHVRIVNLATLQEVALHRPPHQSLISFSNHHTCLDDFLLFGALYGFKDLVNIEQMRWSITAADVCYHQPLISYFFGCGKGIPVWRNVRDPATKELKLQGLGVHQPSMNFAVDLLNNGHWVHIYPQGRIIYPHDYANEHNIRFRWGTGRLILDTKQSPLLLPIYMVGAEGIAPLEQPYWKSIVRQLMGKPQYFTIVVGKPFLVPDSLMHPHDSLTNHPNLRQHTHAKLTHVVQESLFALKKVALMEHEKHKSECP